MSSRPPEHTNTVADSVAYSADQAIKSTQRVANDVLDSLSGSVEDMRHQATPLLNRATEQVGSLAGRGMDAVRESSHKLRLKAQHASDSTLNYVRTEPLKAVLIAAATGAVLMALISLMRRHD